MVRFANCFIICSLSIIPACGTNEQPPSQNPSSIATTPKREQFGEFSFEVPTGWSRNTPDRSKTKSLILLGGTRWTNSKGMIKVDVGSPAFPTVRETAKRFAQSLNGQVLPDAIDLDGERGVKVTSSSTNMAKPREVIIVYRNGKVYLLMAAAGEGVEVSNALEHVRSTWKWGA